MLDAADAQPDWRRGPGTLRVRSLRHGDTHVVELAGELDIAGLPAVERELERAEDGEARTVVLDLRGLGFIDSSGLRVVVLAHRRQRGRLVVVKGPPRVQRVFEVCGLAKRLPFVDEPPHVNAATAAGGTDGTVGTASLMAITAAASRRAAVVSRADQGALAAAVRELCSRPRVSHLP